MLRLLAIALAASVVQACAPSGRAAGVPVGAVPATPVYAHRLVLALDGLDYRDIAAARERGLFPSFRAPSRLISTFPSISDIAWHEIFGLEPPAGYQRVYFDTTRRAMVGGALDAIRPIEYEERMDLAFNAKMHHLGAYLLSGRISRREVDVATERFFDITGRSTVYVYNVGPDALQHTRGDLSRYLAHLSDRVEALSREYHARTGTALEIVILSDHGHNHAVSAKFLPVSEVLAASGFHPGHALAAPRDVAFSVDGVTTGFGVYAAPPDVDSVSATLVRVDGVDVVSVLQADGRVRIRARRADGQVTAGDGTGIETGAIDARIDGGGARYRYTPISGDPLGYAGIVAAMRASGQLDADGFADEDAWVRASSMAHFPVAPVRIMRGHTRVTRNPAPILVSVGEGYQVGLGAVSVVNRLRPLGGTHGSLSERDAQGVVMTNFTETRDDVTFRVREQFGAFTDLRALPPTSSAARPRTERR